MQVKSFPGTLVWVGNGDVLVIGQCQETFPKRAVCVCVGEGGYEKGKRGMYRVCSVSAAPSCSLAVQKLRKGSLPDINVTKFTARSARRLTVAEGCRSQRAEARRRRNRSAPTHNDNARARDMRPGCDPDTSHDSLHAGPAPPRAPTWRAWMSKITTEAGPPRASGMLLTILESVAAVATSPSTSICSRRGSMEGRMAHQSACLCADGLLEARLRIIQSPRPRQASPAQPASQHVTALPALRCLC